MAGRRPIRRLRLRRVVLVGALVLVGFLYYHPLRTYVDTRRQVNERRAEVRSLRAEKAKLERQLKRAATPAALARQARMQLSLVKPGEQLYIVKGIEDWRGKQRR